MGKNANRTNQRVNHVLAFGSTVWPPRYPGTTRLTRVEQIGWEGQGVSMQRWWLWMLTVSDVDSMFGIVPGHKIGGDFVERCYVLFCRRRLQHHLLNLSSERVPLFTMTKKRKENQLFLITESHSISTLTLQSGPCCRRKSPSVVWTCSCAARALPAGAAGLPPFWTCPGWGRRRTQTAGPGGRSVRPPWRSCQSAGADRTSPCRGPRCGTGLE